MGTTASPPLWGLRDGPSPNPPRDGSRAYASGPYGQRGCTAALRGRLSAVFRTHQLVDSRGALPLTGADQHLSLHLLLPRDWGSGSLTVGSPCPIMLQIRSSAIAAATIVNFSSNAAVSLVLPSIQSNFGERGPGFKDATSWITQACHSPAYP